MSKKNESKRQVGRPKEKESLDTQSILRTALKSFAEKGFGGVTLKSLAEKTGIADSLLHYHFGNKEELWKKAMKLAGAEIQTELKDLFQVIDDLDGMEQVRLFNKKIVFTSAKYPEFQQVVVQEVFSESPRSQWLIENLLEPLFSHPVKILEEEKKKGTIKNIPNANLMSFIIGSITTIFSRSFMMKKMFGIDAFDKNEIAIQANVINDLIFNGMINNDK